MIRRADIQDAACISELGRTTFLEAHEHSSPKEELDAYLGTKFSIEQIAKELEDPANLFHLYFVDGKAAGYSKIIFNIPLLQVPEAANICKLERLYISREFYGKKIGSQLFYWNRDLCMKNDQSGMWLTVWTENERAIAFYEKEEFRIVGEVMFKVGNTENPNYVMWLEF